MPTSECRPGIAASPFPPPRSPSSRDGSRKGLFTKGTGRSLRRSGLRCRPSGIGPGVANPIDYFILPPESLGISPPEAEKSTLLKRLCLDLVGLLPALDAEDSFRDDRRGDFVSNQAERLLASPQSWLLPAGYGRRSRVDRDVAKRMSARCTLPSRLAVAAQPRPAAHQFIIEQLAGDFRFKVPHRTRSSRPGSCATR